MAARKRRRRRIARGRIAFYVKPNRSIADKTNPLETWTDRECFENLRFNKPAVVWITELVHGDLVRITRRNKALPPKFVRVRMTFPR